MGVFRNSVVVYFVFSQDGSVYATNSRAPTCLLTTLVKERGSPFSARTVLRWLHEQGFRYGRDCKGVFKDGHEREDVVQNGILLSNNMTL